ncbi:ferredoxin [Rubidibacter lacunae KORDI 51-2]|uniref:Ferredoxin n=1 Tax=Rubidibacter lacunae KORDI 51-2 TaxID=582515 RepID=U5DLT1_9CHRO|nr:2Fe-2S iron-sulfur cluster-binding protein [Rubidibacter lacunae]ERN41539.1 ferredoxin [Rubidibacter lacunae KORDI 51-2]
MPTVTAQGKVVACDRGANLRQVLLENNIDIYNGPAQQINCHGFGTCGTCAAWVEGDVSESAWREQARLGMPPHNRERGLRLTCQTKVLGDVRVTKYEGFWGESDRVAWTPGGKAAAAR